VSSEEPLRRDDTADAVRSADSPEAFDLLVVDGLTSQVVHLAPGAALVAGRAPDADLKLHDASVSKRHARLTVAGTRVLVEDLGSHNGTTVNGERISAIRVLAAGDVVNLGETTLVVFAARQAARRATLASAAEIRRRLEQEIERSVRYGRPFALAVVEEPGDAFASAAVAVALSSLRAMDAAALDGDRLVVLLPELVGEEVDAAVRRLVASLAQAAGAGVRAGVAACPADGCDPDTLLAAARSAAAAAKSGEVASAGAGTLVFELGERVLLVADPPMRRLVELARRLASADLSVLVTGETGTGKENIALALHRWSPRAARPFVTLNAASLPETLLESELFGFEKGAFSGASSPKQGLLERADGGTVLLDEVGELSPTAQAKLLRVLETKRVTRLGDVKEREIDIRVVAATNRDLPEEVKAGRFREDLYFRLAAATLALPPLRSRPRELPLLAQRYLAEACTRAGRAAIRISAPTMHRLARYAWPGNVRELKNAMDLVAATIPDDVLEPWHLPERIAGPPVPEPAAPEREGPRPQAHTFRPVYDEVKELEKRRIHEALEAAGGVRTRAAQLIGMPRRTFLMKLKQYGLGSEEG
jgi:two-component system, NtrC family, response regulator AtoC